MIKIAKFGGSSVADAEHFKKIKAIVDADPARRFVVVSACGRRFKGDTKVTDLLYLVNAHVKYHVSCEELLEDIGQRYFDIADELELTYPIREEFAAFAERARSGGYSTEELVSRGEYFTARLMSEYLGLPFLDAATVVAFHHDGTLSMNRTSELVQEYGQQGGFVMPGFYGATREGQIKLLDRGGGDISGSILAKCLGADLYENWTDVSGFYSADPRIVPEAQPIARVTYEELRELSYMGASVLHEEAVFPVREAGIPLVIKNTNAPQDPGTIISETADEGEAEPIITGVTGKRGFVAINVARDRTKHQVAEVTSLGLVQMTRKRIGQGLVEAFSEECPTCKGRGFILHDEPTVSADYDDPYALKGGDPFVKTNKHGHGTDVQVPKGSSPDVKAKLAQIAAAAVAANNAELGEEA